MRVLFSEYHNYFSVYIFHMCIFTISNHSEMSLAETCWHVKVYLFRVGRQSRTIGLIMAVNYVHTR